MIPVNCVSMRKFWLLILLSVCNVAFGRIETSVENFDFIFNGMFKPEMVYGNAFSRLNTNDGLDKSLFWRHTIDFSFDVLYGKKLFDHAAAEFYFTLRNRALWGTVDNLLKTTSNPIKILEVIDGNHTHSVPRQLFWLREAWLEFQLADILSLPLSNQHTFKFGAFPYSVGYGIALGDAYAVGPDLLGFFTNDLVDQYAYGALLTNEILHDVLYHDFYVALLQSRCSLGEVNAKTRGQQYGHLNHPERGFGRINFVATHNFTWYAFKNEVSQLYFSPYFIYNNDPEQEVEFYGDAHAKLGTIGCSGEYIGKQWEFGFDGAMNFGRQWLYGWDRNATAFENREGQMFLVNDHVVVDNPETGSKALYVPGGEIQTIIDKSERSAAMNGKLIGVVDGVSIFNAPDRFRDPSSRKLNGWMFVADASYAVDPALWPFLQPLRDLQFAATVGVASGVDNPIGCSYDGFVGLQEQYAGNRVKGAFLLGGSGRVARFLSKPEENTQPDQFIDAAISGFTNLAFGGVGINWNAKNWKKPFKFNPNILAYAQQTRTGCARNFLGVESNLFASCALLKDLDLFMVGALFFPGSHYKDRKGTVGLNKTQEDIADQPDVTGYESDPIPKYSDNIALTLNIGLKFSF